jgi:hypothetical protein
MRRLAHSTLDNAARCPHCPQGGDDDGFFCFLFLSPRRQVPESVRDVAGPSSCHQGRAIVRWAVGADAQRRMRARRFATVVVGCGRKKMACWLD